MSTTPAIRLPSVCWAARPNTTATIAPETASVRGSSPAMLSATSTAATRNPSRIRKPTVPAVAGSMRRNSAGRQRAPDVAREAPAEDQQRDRGDDAHRHVEPEDLLAVLVGEQHAAISGMTIASSSRARAALCAAWTVSARARAAGCTIGRPGSFEARHHANQHCALAVTRGPVARRFVSSDHHVDWYGERLRAAQNSVSWRTSSRAGGRTAAVRPGAACRAALNRPVRLHAGRRAARPRARSPAAPARRHAAAARIQPLVARHEIGPVGPQPVEEDRRAPSRAGTASGRRSRPRRPPSPAR